MPRNQIGSVAGRKMAWSAEGTCAGDSTCRHHVQSKNIAKRRLLLHALDRGCREIRSEASLGGKWLGLLRELAPAIVRAGIMFNPRTSPSGGSYYMHLIEDAAKSDRKRRWAENGLVC